MISAELKVVGGKHAGQVIPLNRRKFLIGREQDCQLRPNSEMVSRHHCVFSLDDFSVRLRDLGSTNGTLVNGERIQRETVLSNTDRILIGNLEFELVVRTDVQAPEADSRILPTAVLASGETQVSAPTVTEVPLASAGVAPVPGEQTVTMPVSASDTTVMAVPQMMPGQYPYQPMMPQMGGYPGGMYGGFPFQPQMMPGYGQMYPPMMPQMGYPMGGGMMMPGMQGLPGMMPQAPMQPAPSAPAGGDAGKLEVLLPDPSTTGAKEGEPSKGSTGASPKDSTKPTGAADAILKKALGHRG
jgi:pSer/pThr/pTyr-binding forkhead associated (FHA) protein